VRLLRSDLHPALPSLRSQQLTVMCSHNVAAQGKYIAFVSTTVETGTPEAELTPGIRLLGPLLEKFVIVSDILEPLSNGKDDNCFISTGYDATSHFESTIDDVLAMYHRITGEALDVSSPLVEGIGES
jgi:Rab GDP dissociation inhibitor